MNSVAHLELSDVFRAGFQDYLKTSPLLPKEHYSVVNSIMACHTAALGGHIYKCDTCGHDKISYNSCRNRHCPSCQAMARARWVEKRVEELLPVPYFHLVFTIPDTLNPFALRNKACVYNLLFRAANETLQTLAADPKRLGAQMGFIAVLHTWGQNLLDHPHLHCVVPAGGLENKNHAWKPCPHQDFLFPVRVLSKLFRGKFLDCFKRAIDNKEIIFHGDLQKFQADPTLLTELLNKLYRQDWVVYAKAPFGSSEAVLKYLGRYTHRIAIANSRLASLTDTQVTFRYKDYADHDLQKHMTVQTTEFIRRFLLHVLPSGFVRIRYFGFLSCAAKTEKLSLCKKLLGQKPPTSAVKTKHWSEIIAQLTGTDPLRCPQCGKGRLQVHRELPSPFANRSLYRVA